MNANTNVTTDNYCEILKVLTLFWMGGGVFLPPLAEKTIFEKFSRAEGPTKFFSEPNLVLRNLAKF